MRTLRGVKAHPYAPAYGARIAAEETPEKAASPLRHADDQIVSWAANYWPQADPDEFEWGIGGMRVRHRETLTRRDDLVIDMFRLTGSSMLRGVPARPPRLPRSTRTRTILKLEAKRDRRVPTAYEAAIAQATEREMVRQLQPRILRRSCGQILDVR
jgi:hypothetical protein